MIEIVEGKPIRVGERELQPLVRIESYAQRQASVGGTGLAGLGYHRVHMRPVAIVERSMAGERRIPIRDRTMQAIGGLLLAAFTIPLLLALAVRLAGSQDLRKRGGVH